MRRWQVWYFGRSGQILFWIAVVLGSIYQHNQKDTASGSCVTGA